MFSKILIANRGEIACRVIKTARRMGIQTVAVHSEADRDALHVQMADEAVAIGPAPSAQSYLVIERIVAACRRTGAQAVHPGYGFLSENRAFQQALNAAGITFIGPDAHAIAAMGDKIESKKLAAKAGVSTVPGYTGVIKDEAEAVAIARGIGYPVMIKASAGGGGKGMRLARNDREAAEGFRSATGEARASFGDDRVFVEKFIENPRHIEIQVLADGHGNTVHLGERECSIQRRHQKVIEEAPSPFLDPATRKAMGEQAVALARAVDYKSAGTVEFIVDAERNFYFLEMNTRLQVEHPVTEMVTGLDLVELMIRVAAGQELPFTQDQVRLDGWAIEARVYAEDPTRGFLPSTGRLVRYQPPAECGGVRVDTGVFEGGEISVHYDPMIAKLVAHGATRLQATARLRAALDAYVIRGVGHNIPFLAALMAHPRFGAGRLTTGFIAEEYPDGFHGADLGAEGTATLVAVAAIVHHSHAEREARPGTATPGFRRAVSGDWVVRLGETDHAVRVRRAPDGDGGGNGDGWTVEAQGRAVPVSLDWTLGETLARAVVGGRPACAQIDRRGVGYHLSHAGATVRAMVLSPRGAELMALMPHKVPPDLSRFLLSPMPGLLVSVAVLEGQEVKAGETLAVVEAMKMENVLRAERDVTVTRVHVAAGSSLVVDQTILEFAA